MLIAERNGLMVKNTSINEPTLAQFFNNELEEIVIPDNISYGVLPFYFSSWATNLKVIRQEGFPNCNIISVYTAQQMSAPNIEHVELKMVLFGLQSKYNLRVAKGTALPSAEYAFTGTGSNLQRTDIYTLDESASVILGKITQYWQKTIVFHGNDGKKVYYDGSDWVIADDEEAGWQNADNIGGGSNLLRLFFSELLEEEQSSDIEERDDEAVSYWKEAA